MSSQQEQPGMIDGVIAKALAKYRLQERLELIEIDIKTIAILTAAEVGPEKWRAARARARQMVEEGKGKHA